MKIFEFQNSLKNLSLGWNLDCIIVSKIFKMVHQIRRYWPTKFKAKLVFLKVWRYQKVKSVARRLRKSIIDQTCASARACLFRHGMKYVVSMWNTQCFLRKVRERRKNVGKNTEQPFFSSVLLRRRRSICDLKRCLCPIKYPYSFDTAETETKMSHWTI